MRRRNRTRSAATVVALAAVAVLGLPGPASSSAASDALHVDALPAVWHVGDTITVSGTGCRDRTGGGAARQVVFLIGTTNWWIDPVSATADGTFSATRTITEPVVDGTYALQMTCVDPAAGESFDPLDTATQQVSVVGAPLDLQPSSVAADGTFTFRAPCGYDGAATGATSISLTISEDGRDGQLRTATPSADLGDPVSVDLADQHLEPGAYVLSAWCTPYRSYPCAHTASATLTVLPAGTAPAPAPTPAAPVDGAAAYTG